MPIVLERAPTASLVQAEGDFPVQSTGASVFAEDDLERRGRLVSPSEAESWARLLIAVLSDDESKTDVHRVVREMPRLQAFRVSLEQFLRSNFRARAAQRQSLADNVRTTAVPSMYIQEILRQCSTGGGSDGLDIGIDLLHEFGDLLPDTLRLLLKSERPRWQSATLAKHVNDDVCYILLRALARSNASADQKLPLLEECASHGTRSIREAATHALGDLQGDDARRLLQRMASQDPDPLVRESAQETLQDLDA